MSALLPFTSLGNEVKGLGTGHSYGLILLKIITRLYRNEPTLYLLSQLSSGRRNKLSWVADGLS
jgi:hypothetical protein